MQDNLVWKHLRDETDTTERIPSVPVANLFAERAAYFDE